MELWTTWVTSTARVWPELSAIFHTTIEKDATLQDISSSRGLSFYAAAVVPRTKYPCFSPGILPERLFLYDWVYLFLLPLQQVRTFHAGGFLFGLQWGSIHPDSSWAGCASKLDGKLARFSSEELSYFIRYEDLSGIWQVNLVTKFSFQKLTLSPFQAHRPLQSTQPFKFKSNRSTRKVVLQILKCVLSLLDVPKCVETSFCS